MHLYLFQEMIEFDAIFTNLKTQIERERETFPAKRPLLKRERAKEQVLVHHQESLWGCACTRTASKCPV